MKSKDVVDTSKAARGINKIAKQKEAETPATPWQDVKALRKTKVAKLTLQYLEARLNENAAKAVKNDIGLQLQMILEKAGVDDKTPLNIDDVARLKLTNRAGRKTFSVKLALERGIDQEDIDASYVTGKGSTSVTVTAIGDDAGGGDEES